MLEKKNESLSESSFLESRTLCISIFLQHSLTKCYVSAVREPSLHEYAAFTSGTRDGSGAPDDARGEGYTDAEQFRRHSAAQGLGLSMVERSASWCHQ